MLTILLEQEHKKFKSYVDSFLTPTLELNNLHLGKYEHSLRVLENAKRFIENEKIFAKANQGQLLPDANKILLLAALYHDLGRFEQIRQFKSFNDALSFNHARLSAQLLADKKFMTHETASCKSFIRAAIALHNLPTLPKHLKGNFYIICEALREADKVDIIQILLAEFKSGSPDSPIRVNKLATDPLQYNPSFLHQALHQEPTLYTEMKSVTDFKLVICGWVLNLQFATSIKILKEQNCIERLKASLPKNKDFLPLLKALT